MHISSKKRMKWFFDNYEGLIRNNSIGTIKLLDIGGVDINGSYKDICPNDFKRDVLDIQPGKDVNIIPENPYKWNEIEDDTYDVIISGNTFQHIEYFWKTMQEVARVLKAGGLFCLIVPSNRYEEKYPIACWAFNSDGLAAMAKSAGLEALDVSIAGMPEEKRDEDWIHPLDDAMLIAQKPGKVKIHNPPKLCFEYRYDALDEIFTNKLRRMKKNGIDKVIICPYGRYGHRLKMMIDEKYSDIAYIIADNKLCDLDQNIYSVRQAKEIEGYAEVILCLKNYWGSSLYDEINREFAAEHIYNFFE